MQASYGVPARRIGKREITIDVCCDIVSGILIDRLQPLHPRLVIYLRLPESGQLHQLPEDLSHSLNRKPQSAVVFSEPDEGLCGSGIYLS